MKQPAIYIMASGRHGTLYVGVTYDLARRVWQHRTGETPGFTSRYGCKRLVHYELHETMENAIGREKQIKNWPRSRKIALIEAENTPWFDLWANITV
jgi:putative endonuclease